MATPPKPPIVDASTGTVNPAEKARFEAEIAQYKADVQKELNVATQEHVDLLTKQAKLEGEFITKRGKELIAIQEQIALEEALLGIATASNDKKKEAQALARELMAEQNISAEEQKRFIDDALAAQGDILELRQANLREIRATGEELGKVKEKTDELRESATGALEGFAGILGITNHQFPLLKDISDETLNFGEKALVVADAFGEVFSLTNLALSAMQGMGEQILELISLQNEFTKATGMSAEFSVKTIDGARSAANEFAGALVVTRAEAAQAAQALTTGLPAFTRLTQDGRNELAGMTAALQQVGVDAGTSAIILNEMMSVMNIGALEAAPMIHDLTEEMHKFGITPNEFSENLATMLPRFAEFGKTGLEIFTDLSKQAKALNVSVSDIVDSMSGFDTFEDAAPRVAKLNALMSTLTGTTQSLFNTNELVMAVNPADRFALIAEKIDQSGMNLKEMAQSSLPGAKFALRAFAQEANTSVDGLIKMYDRHRQGNLEMVEGQTSLADAMKEAQTPTELFQNVLQQMMDTGVLQELTTGLIDFMKGISTFAEETKDAFYGLKNIAMSLIKLFGANMLFKLVMGLKPAFVAAQNGATGFAGAMRGVGGAVKGAMRAMWPLMAIMGAIQGLIVGVGTGSLSEGLKAFASGATMGLSDSLFPAMAKGGVVGSQGTMALVGERGPEIVGLPGKSAVSPLPRNGLGVLGGSEEKIAKAVASAMAPIMDKVNGALEKVGNSDVYLDGNKVGKYVDGRMVSTMGRYVT